MATLIQYDHSPKVLVNGTINWLTDDVKLALVDSDYTPSLAHTAWASVSADVVGSPVSLASKSADNDKLTAANLTLSSLTATFRYIVLYAEGVDKGPDDITDPLIGYYDMGTDVIVDDADYPINFSGSGIIALANE